MLNEYLSLIPKLAVVGNKETSAYIADRSVIILGILRERESIYQLGGIMVVGNDWYETILLKPEKTFTNFLGKSKVDIT